MTLTPSADGADGYQQRRVPAPFGTGTHPKRPHGQMTYEELCTFQVLYDAYLTARVGKRSKPGTAQYEANALAYTDRLAYILATGEYRPSKFEIFKVYEPKERLVQAPAFVDKVVQHALVDNILYSEITSSFIECNYASQVWKGMHFGLSHLEQQMRDYYLKRKGHDEAARKAAGLPYRPREEWDYAEGWVLKADVRHFFASIDHELLKEKLALKISDPKVYRLMCTYIDSTSGLPLGYQTSQLLALLFLDEFDHWVKEKLHAKYYGRYMDDFYIISDSKEFLRDSWRQIDRQMERLKLELNEKTAIFPLRNGISFLGFHTYLDDGGAVIMKLRQDSIDRMNARIKTWRKEAQDGTLDRELTVTRWRSWDAHAAHGDTFELRKKIAAIVSEITGITCTAREPIRAGKYDKAKDLVRKMNRQRRRPPAQEQQKVPTGLPW